MSVIWGGVIVLVVQVITGLARAWAARELIRKARAAGMAGTELDVQGEVTVGKTTVKLDKSDILAIAFAIFVFWAVGTARLGVEEATAAFVAILAGTGVKELIQALVPSR
jgi:hypothetical protein